MAEPTFKTFKEAEAYTVNRTREVGTQISRETTRLNQQLNKSYADFIQDNPNSLLKTEQDFEAYKAKYNPGDVQDRFQAYFDVYGPQGGVERAFNYTGIAPIWFGANQKETREFDPSTLKYNPETGGFQAQLRIADKEKNRSFTAPITAAGRKVAQLFGFGGKEAVEENTFQELPIETLEKMYIEANDFVGQKIGEGGQIRALQTPNTNNVLNRYAFDTSEEGRSAKEKFLLDASGFEAGLVTEGEEPPQDQPDSVLSTQTIGQEVIDAAKDPSGTKPSGQLGVQGEVGDFANLVRISKNAATLKKALPEDFYFEPNFEFSEEQKQTLSNNEKKLIKERLQTASNNNLKQVISNTKQNAVQAANSIDDVPGATAEETTQTKNIGSFYSTKEKELNKIFAARPSLYDEFKADSNAFALKYSNPEEFNKINASSIPQKEKNDVAKNSSITVSASDRKELREAINAKDSEKVGEILERLSQGQTVPQEQQERIVSLLTKTSGYFNVGTKPNSFDEKFTDSLMLDIYASVPKDQRTEAFRNKLALFKETGYFDLSGVEQQRKLDVERRQASAPTSMSDVTKNFLGFITEMSQPNFDINERIDIGQELRAQSNQIQTQADMRAFADAAGVYLKTFFDEKGKPTWVDKILSFGQAKGPASASLSLKPNIQIWDAQYNRTNDPTKAAYFAPMDEGGKAIRGNAVAINTVLEGPGAPAIPLIVELGLQRNKFNMPGGG
jgi:hypothetical protein